MKDWKKTLNFFTHNSKGCNFHKPYVSPEGTAKKAYRKLILEHHMLAISALLVLLVLSVGNCHAVVVTTDSDVETSVDVSGFFTCGEGFGGYHSRPLNGKCVVTRDCLNEEKEKKKVCEEWRNEYSFAEYANHRAGKLVELEKIVWKTDRSNEAKLFYKPSKESVIIKSDFVPWNQSPMGGGPVLFCIVLMGLMTWSIRRQGSQGRTYGNDN